MSQVLRRAGLRLNLLAKNIFVVTEEKTGRNRCQSLLPDGEIEIIEGTRVRYPYVAPMKLEIEKQPEADCPHDSCI